MKAVQWVRWLILALFVTALVAGIIYMQSRAPSEQDSGFLRKAAMFASHAESAHWQWAAEGRPDRILLLLFDERGIERDRRPVAMSPEGWPVAERSNQGCARLWQQVIGEAPRMNQQRIRTEYIGPDDPDQSDLGGCRYAVSMGPSFTYDMNTGKVTR
ncbi:hypothetical protein HMF8227_00280 [Saliniradius amylolyticus]|uniref:Uncharacterized protein n=1 Tax=Saliniradius amylolyticus TaxID=2183582 RepID=A0A2S2DZF6_9ALTE|nr:hypothetical protein [Saliniradius amylolyticus]AWL10788.1 hypothetical protein HMF8227_00280 [Saliniradius amylolyticus]